MKQRAPAAFGHLIKKAREDRGWTHAQLAERLGVGRGYIGQLEGNAIRHPGPDKLAAIERELGVTREEIARANGELGPPTQPDAFAEFRRIRALATEEEKYQALLRLPPDVVETIGDLTLIAARRGFRLARE